MLINICLNKYIHLFKHKCTLEIVLLYSNILNITHILNATDIINKV